VAAAAASTEYLQGLHTDLGQNASKLSGGERQRLALARALLSRPAPRMLLLDEHTSALDEASQRAVQQSLDRLWQESGGTLTVLAIAHRLSNFRGMDKVVVLSKEGRVAEQGSPKEVLRQFPHGIFAGFVRTSAVDFER
jgi:ABC-type multidrug transport system fused ATPase/permease subunit